MLKQPKFFHSQPSTLPKDAPAKFYLFTTFGLSFMISSVAPIRSSTSYTYLITKTGNRNLKVKILAFPDSRDMYNLSVACSVCFYALVN